MPNADRCATRKRLNCCIPLQEFLLRRADNLACRPLLLFLLLLTAHLENLRVSDRRFDSSLRLDLSAELSIEVYGARCCESLVNHQLLRLLEASNGLERCQFLLVQGQQERATHTVRLETLLRDQYLDVSIEDWEWKECFCFMLDFFSHFILLLLLSVMWYWIRSLCSSRF